MVHWSSLPPDLVRSVADCVLAANEVDYYMDVRAVCHNWRAALVDPGRHGAALRFRPRNWIMLDEEAPDDGGDITRLFVNVCTGRFIRRRVPTLGDHVLVAASDGLLVLADREYPHAAAVLNPFTGWFLRFAAAIPRVSRVRAAVDGSEDDAPSLVFTFFHDPYDDALSWAHSAASELSRVGFPHAAGPLLFSQPASMVAYKGHVYVADREPEGPVVKLVFTSAQQHRRYCHAELIVAKAPDATAVSSQETTGGRRGRAFLVVSAGELLLVWRRRSLEVFRVDVERKTLETVMSIGHRALFLGDRCLSVDAENFPSVDGNCVYLVTGSGKGVWRYDLGDGSERIVSIFRDRPHRMVQILLNHCRVLPDPKAQLHSIYQSN